MNIKEADGDIIDTVGVAGGSSDNDELCALAGIQTVGLFAQTRIQTIAKR